MTFEYPEIKIITTESTILGIEKPLVGERITEVFRIFSNAGKPAFQEVYSLVNKTHNVYRSDSSYTLLTNDNDREIFVDFTLSPININGTKNNGEILVLRDITIEKERQEELRFISQHDHLTGLYNRYHFDEQVKRLDTQRQLPITIIIGDANG